MYVITCDACAPIASAKTCSVKSTVKRMDTEPPRSTSRKLPIVVEKPGKVREHCCTRNFVNVGAGCPSTPVPLAGLPKVIGRRRALLASRKRFSLRDGNRKDMW